MCGLRGLYSRGYSRRGRHAYGRIRSSADRKAFYKAVREEVSLIFPWLADAFSDTATWELAYVWGYTDGTMEELGVDTEGRTPAEVARQLVRAVLRNNSQQFRYLFQAYCKDVTEALRLDITDGEEGEFYKFWDANFFFNAEGFGSGYLGDVPVSVYRDVMHDLEMAMRSSVEPEDILGYVYDILNGLYDEGYMDAFLEESGKA